MRITPTQTDVKPNTSHNHPGNKVYNKLVSSKKKEFILAHKDYKTKNSIAKSIYDAISKQKPPGRFLAEKDGSYIVKSKEDAMKKIKKALNENRVQIEQYFQLRGQFPPSNEKSTSKSKPQPTGFLNKKKPITSSDWTELSSTLTRINSNEFLLAMDNDTRPTKRQKFRELLKNRQSKNQNESKRIKTKKTVDDALCDTVKSMSLQEYRRSRKQHEKNSSKDHRIKNKRSQ